MRTKLRQVCLLCSIGLLLVLGLSQCVAQPPQAMASAQLQRVVSGDVIEVTGLGSQPALIQQVRLIGIDAPELAQKPWGLAARDYLQSRLAEREVRLEYDLQLEDSFGRQLAYLWFDNQLINTELVAMGHALATPYFPNVRYEEHLQAAQETARLIGRGLWYPNQPLREHPADFRQQ